MNHFCQSRIEACILAGGLSSRMGRDKARLRLGGKTLLGHVRDVAKDSHLPARIIRKDLVRRCGPLGGVYTALRSTKAEAVLFLSCDMPFVTPDLLWRICERLQAKAAAVFVRGEKLPGFPFIVRRSALPEIEGLIQAGEFSLRTLADRLNAKMLRLSRAEMPLIFNVNTAEDYNQAKTRWAAKRIGTEWESVPN